CALLLSACGTPVPTDRPDGQLTDQDIMDYATTGYDREEMMFQRVELGRHNDTLLIAEFPCSDLCPDNTTRLIRYDVENEECAAIGGVLHKMFVPLDIAMVEKEYCFPGVLIEHWEQYIR
ncbi:MAG: hypothetical protein PVJ34_19705, partial [Anaerolineae bacterium]